MPEERKQIVHCARGTKHLYDKIRETLSHRYLKTELYQIFCLAAAIGFREKKFESFTRSHPGGLFRVESMEKDTNAIRFIQAMAISYSKNLNILREEVKTYNIAECFANGGIKILYSMICGNVGGADFVKEVEKRLIEIARSKN